MKNGVRLIDMYNLEDEQQIFAKCASLIKSLS